MGWSLFNDKDDIDVGSIDKLERAIGETGEVKGWATGLCLWKRGEEGWVVEKEFGFMRDDRMVDRSLRARVRNIMSASAEDLVLKRIPHVEKRHASV